MKIYPGELNPSDSFNGKSQYRNQLVEERTGSMRQKPK